MSDESELPNLAELDLTLEDIEASGWSFEYNGYRHFFRNRKTRMTKPVPQWAATLINRAWTNAEASTQQNIRNALGIKPNPPLAKPATARGE